MGWFIMNAHKAGSIVDEYPFVKGEKRKCREKTSRSDFVGLFGLVTALVRFDEPV